MSGVLEQKPLGGGSSGGAVTTVAGRTGDVVLTAADVGAGQLPVGVLLPSGVAIPSNASATTKAANDNSTSPATTAYVDAADALKANLASPALTGTPTVPTAAQGTNTTQAASTAMVHSEVLLLATLASPTFTGSPVLPTGTTVVTQAAGDNSTKAASTAYVDGAPAGFKIGPHTYANFRPSLASTQGAQQNAGDAKYSMITIEETGHLRDLSVYIATANAGNSHLLVLDTGQANATHTTCTCLAISGSLSGASTGWMTYDPNLAVTKGDTLYVAIQNPDTTIKPATTTAIVAAGITLMPTSSFLPSSGAGTTNQKLSGNILNANVPTIVTGTVTTANMANAPANEALFLWRIS